MVRILVLSYKISLMKAKSSIIGFAAMLFATAWTAPSPMVLSNDQAAGDSEVETDFSFARLEVHPGGITTTWSVMGAGNIESFVVQKTSADPGDENAYWKDVATITNDGSPSYKFTDSKYVKGESNYRIIAIRPDNSAIVSEVMTAGNKSRQRD